MNNHAYVTRGEPWVHKTAKEGIRVIENTRTLLEMRDLIRMIPKMQSRWFHKKKDVYSNDEILAFATSIDPWYRRKSDWNYYDLRTLTSLYKSTDPCLEQNKVPLSNHASSVLEWVASLNGADAVQMLK